MILELKKIKSLTVSIVSPSICHEVMGPDAISFIFLKVDMSQDIEKILYNYLANKSFNIQVDESTDAINNIIL